MTVHFMDMMWSINARFGVGLDIESSSSRPVWVQTNEKVLEAMEFDGLIISIPFFVISIGRVWRVEDDEL
jgi:hypothetical protein